MGDLTNELWDCFGTTELGDLPDDVVEVAHHAILDWFGCAIAGSCEPLTAILREELATSPGPALLLGTSQRTAPLPAALINGAAGHALDFDDTSIVMGGHPTAPVLPAVLALADELGSSGAEVVTAYVVGHEVEARVGRVLGAEHYVRGWHQTSTAGVFGAAAACAHLLRVNAAQFGHAMGLAASNAAGLKVNFGTMTKPFHAGHAAERGLLAARLAARGFTADSTALEAEHGLAAATSGVPARVDRLGRADGRWLILQNLFKYHAACYLTHAGIEATASVLEAGDDVRGIDLTVHPSLLDVCNIAAPRTGLEAKFSLAATQAFVVHGIDTTDPASFEDRVVARADVQALLPVVRVSTDPSLPTTQTLSVVETASATRAATYDTGVPATDLARQRARLTAKFRGLATPVVGRERADELATALGALATAPDLSVLDR